MYFVFNNIWRNKNEKTKKKDNTDTPPYRFFINSKAINQNKLKNLQLTGRKHYLLIFKIGSVRVVVIKLFITIKNYFYKGSGSKEGYCTINTS